MFLPGRVNPVVLRRNSTALFLLQRVRDEAHRFAITYHRQLRRRERLRSVLDSIPGVGAARRQRLLRHFGSVRRMRDATVTALAEVPGTSPARAEEIKSALEGLASAAETDRASVQASTAPGDPANRDDNRAHRLRAALAHGRVLASVALRPQRSAFGRKIDKASKTGVWIL